MASKWGLKEKLAELQRMKSTLPTKLANEAKNHFLQSFRDGGFTDRNLSKWKPRKVNAKNNIGRGILIKTGNLRRSVKVRSVSWNRVVIGSYGLKYASVHNYGERAGRGKGFKMPKRQFIGNSVQLENRMKKMVNSDFGKILK